MSVPPAICTYVYRLESPCHKRVNAVPTQLYQAAHTVDGTKFSQTRIYVVLISAT
ncbi:MAG: hypothetical protein ACFFCH_00400 [Promethearchaeota archaeon]